MYSQVSQQIVAAAYCTPTHHAALYIYRSLYSEFKTLHGEAGRCREDTHRHTHIMQLFIYIDVYSEFKTLHGEAGGCRGALGREDAAPRDGPGAAVRTGSPATISQGH